jgi:hypothetical protein
MRRLGAFCIALVVLSGCGAGAVRQEAYPPASSYNEKTEHEGLRRIDTVVAYDAFLEAHPQSDWRDSVIYFRDRAALNDAKAAGTPEALQDFLQKYPNSDWADQARYLLKNGVR